MKKDFLFVYGTLMRPHVQRKVFGRSIHGDRGALFGYRRSSITTEGEKYPIIVPARGRSVRGVVLPVSLKDIARADIYEGRMYRRRRVVLLDGTRAWAYSK